MTVRKFIFFLCVLFLFFPLKSFSKNRGNAFSSLTVSPNPFRPNDGNTLTGNPGGGISFANLPVSIRIRIFSIMGKKVVDKSVTTLAGNYLFNLKNKSGRLLASGFYIYVLQSSDGSSRSGRFAFIR